MVVADRAAMISGMAPVLTPGRFVFCSFPQEASVEVMTAAVAMFREAEGVSLILPAALSPPGVQASSEMRMITLTVQSSLNGIGLTAAVATALAGAGIPCNMVAAFHHDHVFVPAEMADRALAVLRSLSASEKAPSR